MPCFRPGPVEMTTMRLAALGARLGCCSSQARQFSLTVVRAGNARKSLLRVAAAGVAAGGLGLLYCLEHSVKASDLELHPYQYPWAHRGYLSSMDMASVRRGWQVYKQVCAACHSLQFLQYIHFIDAFMTTDEAKAEAAEQEFEDGPDEQGKMFMRPGKITDYLPKPYPNEAAAKAANNGAAPPELSLITQARMEKGGEDYLFSLLTGYEEEPPAGVELGEGQAYNPYFTGGVLSMAQQLFDEGVEFEDGTPATQSQQAKDVSAFLKWAAEPRDDAWKLTRLKMLITFPFFVAGLMYMKKIQWSILKTQKVYWQRVPYRGHTPGLLNAAARRSPHDVNNTPKVP